MEEKSDISVLVDMPLEQFKEELVKQNTNIGVASNMILLLNAIYEDLKQRKDLVLDLVFNEGRDKEDPEIKKSLEGLYALMTKVELKITHLQEYKKGLIDLDKTP